MLPASLSPHLAFPGAVKNPECIYTIDALCSQNTKIPFLVLPLAYCLVKQILFLLCASVSSFMKG